MMTISYRDMKGLEKEPYDPEVVLFFEPGKTYLAMASEYLAPIHAARLPAQPVRIVTPPQRENAHPFVRALKDRFRTTFERGKLYEDDEEGRERFKKDEKRLRKSLGPDDRTVLILVGYAQVVLTPEGEIEWLEMGKDVRDISNEDLASILDGRVKGVLEVVTEVLHVSSSEYCEEVEAALRDGLWVMGVEWSPQPLSFFEEASETQRLEEVMTQMSYRFELITHLERLIGTGRCSEDLLSFRTMRELGLVVREDPDGSGLVRMTRRTDYRGLIEQVLDRTSQARCYPRFREDWR